MDANATLSPGAKADSHGSEFAEKGLDSGHLLRRTSVGFAVKWHERLRRSAILNAALAEIVHDRALYAVVSVYALIALGLAHALGATDRLVPWLYLPMWSIGLLVSVMFYVLLYEVPLAVSTSWRDPLTRALQAAWRKLGPRVIPGISLLLTVAIFKGLFTSIKNMLPLVQPYGSDEALANLDLHLHGGHDPWILLQSILGHPLATRTIEYAYSFGWTLLLIGFPAILALHPKLGRLRVRYCLTMFLCFMLLGNLLAGAYLSGGPAFYAQFTGDHARFGEISKHLIVSSGLNNSAADLQAFLLRAYVSDKLEVGSGISAFPSMHLSMATLYALAAWRLDRRFGVVMSAFWLVIMAGSVHLGWHYAVDGYVASLCTILIWGLCGRLERLTRQAGTSQA